MQHMTMHVKRNHHTDQTPSSALNPTLSSICAQATPLHVKLAADMLSNTARPTPSAGSPECCCQPVLQWQHRPGQWHPQLGQPQRQQCHLAGGTPRQPHPPQTAGPSVVSSPGVPLQSQGNSTAQQTLSSGNAPPVACTSPPNPPLVQSRCSTGKLRASHRHKLRRLLGNSCCGACGLTKAKPDC